MNIIDIRDQFVYRYEDGNQVTDKSGCSMLEICGASFIASEDHIFGRPNKDYIEREIRWYESMSKNVNDIEGEVPEIWKKVSDSNGHINSNYGWCLFSEENFNQYGNVVAHLQVNPDTRQAIAIYNRPNMHIDAFAHGRHDFMCTNAHQYLLRDDQLHVVVQMRSNDVMYGFRNDLAWAKYAQDRVLGGLKVNPKFKDVVYGNIYWQVGSLHIYERDFYLVHHYLNSGETHISKRKYKELYETDSE